MKKMTCLLLLLSLSYQPFAQTPAPSQKQDLWQKSKQQRTIAWVLLGAGLAVELVSLTVASQDLLIDAFTGKESSKGTGGAIAGVALMAGSIPFFIMAGKNRRLSLAATSFQNLAPQNNAPLLTFQKKPGFQLTLTQKLF